MWREKANAITVGNEYDAQLLRLHIASIECFITLYEHSAISKMVHNFKPPTLLQAKQTNKSNLTFFVNDYNYFHLNTENSP